MGNLHPSVSSRQRFRDYNTDIGDNDGIVQSLLNISKERV
nr:MAG TPA: hypothetical protein [Caudoviricetes sp.]